ncbi:MAG: hypothetical protein AMS14_06205 [Planctomycetes bacterium DG_20]|nr:MAG: hypothetical protein AMS14_06205 [Planctomycetes bacterium DG_20]
MTILPIGTVIKQSQEESILDIDPVHAEGLDGIEAGDRLQVLYWMHELSAKDRTILKVRPRGDTSRALKGVFGLRSPLRPNPIGVSTVEVGRVEGSRVFVTDLDARDGSPIIDIKAAMRDAPDCGGR